MILSELASLINLILKNRGKAEVHNISEGSHLRDDLGFDSLDLAELTVRIEAECETDIFANGIVNKVGEILEKTGNK